MSNLLSTTAMVTECATRVPIGLTQAFWMKKLNEAFRWISQKGNYIWDVKWSTVTVTTGSLAFDIPAGCDPGKPMYLAGPTTGAPPIASVTMDSVIPYKPWDESLEQQQAEVTAPPGMYSCWTLATLLTGPSSYSYRGMLYPSSARPLVGNFNFTFVYHTDVSSTEYAIGSNVYFPTPNSFDNLLIELAEAEVRRIYGLAGWEIIQKRAESGIMNLLDSYRSTKNVLAGLVDQQKQVQERKLMSQENS